MFVPSVYAQYWNTLDVKITQDGNELRNPCTGGLNKPQFSEVDLNFDGLMDLYVFDNDGDVSLTFLNEGTSNQTDFHFAPYYTRNFPSLKDWVLLRDYNNDGIIDIFSNSNITGENNNTIYGIIVYRGFNDNGVINFERVELPYGQYNLIYYETPSGAYSNLKATSEDYPAVDDIDGDGDMDILNFEIGGGVLYYYKNNSAELGYGADSLIFILEDDCYGGLFEGEMAQCPFLSENVDDCADPNLANSPEINSAHAGSTLLTLNLDGDNDKDLVLGDLPFSKLVSCINSNTNENAWYTESDCTFPSYNVPADIINFPASFYLDMDNDGVKDLIASPYSTGIVESSNVVWFWKNIGDNEMPNFQFVQRDLLVDNMVDFGKGSKPCFFDYNGDGKLDIVSGNFSYFLPGGLRDPRLTLFINTSTDTEISFDLVDTDFLGFSELASSNNSSLAPCIGDLDGDGDDDLLIGTESGKLFYFENNGGAGNPMEFGIYQYPWLDIDPGQKTTPQIVDINRDGLLDLVIGEDNGNLNYYPNTGTVTAPIFEAEENDMPNNSFFGEVSTDLAPFTTGGTSPIFYDFNGEYVLFSGSQGRGIVRYDDIDGNLDGAFTWTEDFNLGELKEGARVHFDIADLNGDDILDFVIGNDRGGLRIVSSNIDINGDIVSVSNSNLVNTGFKIWPNPVRNKLYIEIDEFKKDETSVRIYNAMGQSVLSKEMNSSNTTINVEHLTQGIYFMSINIGQEMLTKKVIIE